MKNESFNKRRQISKIINNNLLKDLNLNNKAFLNNFILNINDESISNELSSRPSSSIKSLSNSTSPFINKFKLKSHISSNKKDIKEELNKRRDNFGNEIKKGGKHKIAFADEVKILNSFIQFEENKKEKIDFNSKSIFGRSFDIIRSKRRSKTLEYNSSSGRKYIYNIFKNNIYRKKNLEKPIVDIIEIKSIKKETKFNTYFVKNRNNIGEEQDVCCSCYCSIF